MERQKVDGIEGQINKLREHAKLQEKWKYTMTQWNEKTKKKMITTDKTDNTTTESGSKIKNLLV